MKLDESLYDFRLLVGTLWSTVAKVQSGRRMVRLALRRPSKACGEVTSWTMCLLNRHSVPSAIYLGSSRKLWERANGNAPVDEERGRAIVAHTHDMIIKDLYKETGGSIKFPPAATMTERRTLS